MATVSRGLPERPHLDVPKREARELLDEWRAGLGDALERVRSRHPRFAGADDATVAAGPFRLADAQLVLAREYGFPHWTALKQRIEAGSSAQALLTAIQAGDREAAVRIVEREPALLHVPLWSGNWGPPMSHAANLGRLDIVQAMAAAGARDVQHAFDRALLQGQLECARWLRSQGATLEPGIIMGSCETLTASGFEFLVEAGAPITDQHGDARAPVGLVLGTYCRRPAGKHAILGAFERLGYVLPDTPVMALHRGDVGALERQWRRDPSLLARRFSLEEIYPAELGCGPAGGSGMHWTPLDGTTLLHLAIDFEEHEVFDWLLARGADVDARGTVDGDGFGGHTPLFNAVLSHPGGDARFARALLERGASANARASLRKFLDWCAEPRWHHARDVTASEWAHGFPERGWVNAAALAAIDEAVTR